MYQISIFFYLAYNDELMTIIRISNVSSNLIKHFNKLLSFYDRLVILCLLENNGVLQMTREFSVTSMSEDSTNGWPRPIISRVAQLVASVPDKAGLRAPTSLSSQYPYALMYWMLCGLSEHAFISTCLFVCFGKLCSIQL